MSGKKFRFSLQSVLQLRGYETERAKRKLGRVVSERARREEALREAESRLSEAGARPRPVKSAIDLSRHSAGLQQLVEARDAAAERVQQMKKVESEAREILGQRHRKEDALHRLKEGEQSEFQQESDHEEQKQLDEQGVLGYSRQMLPPTTS